MALTLVKGKKINGPDPALVKDQLAGLQEMYRVYGRRFMVRNLLWILRKNPEPDTVQNLPNEHWNRRLVPFRFNRIQRDLDIRMGQRNICNKPRQAGYTTFFINVRLFLPALIEPGAGGLLISQNHRYATAHFGILKRALRYVACLDPWEQEMNLLHRQLRENLLHTSSSNRKELIFDQLDSRVLIESAEIEEAGQGFCLHPDTEIEDINNNLIAYKDLKVGTRIMDECGRPATVKKIYRVKDYTHPYKGKTLKVSVIDQDVSVTCAPNHPWLTQRGMVEAKDLRIGKDYLAYPKRKITGKGQLYDRNLGILCGLYISDDAKISRDELDVPSITKLKKHHIKMRIFPALHKVLGDSDSIDSLQKKWLETNFGTSRSIRFPEWLYSAGVDFLKGLFEGFLTGSGLWFRCALETETKSLRVALAIRNLSAALGFGIPSLYRNGEKISLMFQEQCYDWVAKEYDLPYVPSKVVEFPKQCQNDSHVFVRVSKVISGEPCKEFLDITIHSESNQHLYTLPIGVTHNTLNHVVATEVARWPGNPEETLANLKEAIASGGTLDIESTPNGLGGYYYEEYMRAKRGGADAEFNAFFHPWFWHDEYRIDPSMEEGELNEEERKKKMLFHLDMNQMTWRRKKMVSLRHNFREKYPEDDVSCLTGNSVVVLSDGKNRPISALVNEKYSGKVLSVNSKGELVEADVIGWHRSPRKDRKMYKMSFKHSKKSHNKKCVVRLTEEHQVLTSEGWMRADEANGMMVATGTPAPGPRAFQVMLGTILGDGHITKSGSLQCAQVTPQLIGLKEQVLKGFGSRSNAISCAKALAKWRPKPSKDGWGSRLPVAHLGTKNLPYLRWLRKKFYNHHCIEFTCGKAKHLSFEIIKQIDDFGIAVWFMDDGWSNLAKCKQSAGSRPNAGIALGLTSKKLGKKIAEFLKSKGFDCKCLGKRTPRIMFSCDGAETLYKRIGKYVTPDMRYKLPADAPAFEPKWWDEEKPRTFYDKARVRRIKPQMQKGGKYEKGPLYCLDVKGTHNFVTLGGVVHNCFLTNGRIFFDQDVLAARLAELQVYKPLDSRRDGQICIFQKPNKRRKYLIGADPAEGKQVNNEDSDFSAAKGIDLETGEEVFTYNSRLAPEDFGADLVELGQYYNNALVVCERNNHGGTVILSMKEFGYGNIYKHREWWKREKTTNQRTITEFEGWPTNQRTRKMLLNKLGWMMRNHPELIWDIMLIQQSLTFIYDENGKPAASTGCHDDQVLASALAQTGRLVALGYLDPLNWSTTKYGDFEDEEEESSVRTS